MRYAIIQANLGGAASLAALLYGAVDPLAAQTTSNPTYKLNVLGTSGGSNGLAYGINGVGQTVGSTVSAEGDRHSFLWFNGDTNDLQNVVHFVLKHPYFGVGIHEAYGISNGGQIVGTARVIFDCDPTDVTATTAFIMMPGVLTDLATPYAGDAVINLLTFGGGCTAHDSAATGISNANHVVGWADRNSAGGDTHAFIVSPVNGQWYRDTVNNVTNSPPADGWNDLMIDLGTLDNNASVSAATGVNDSGVVVGYSYTATNTLNGQAAYHAFRVVPVGGLWRIDGYADGANELMEDLGTLGGLNSWARGINNAGVIVGESETSDRHVRAFAWQNGVMSDLGTLGGENSSASRINENGDIVGWSEDSTGVRRATIWIARQPRNLNSLLLATDLGGTDLLEARDINEHGQIVGWGQSANGSSNVSVAYSLRLASQAEIDEANAIIAGLQVTTDPTADTSTDDTTGSSGGTSTGGVAIEGTPGNPGDGTTGAVTDGSVEGTSATPAAGLCGAGLNSLLPLTLLGLAAARRRARA